MIVRAYAKAFVTIDFDSHTAEVKDTWLDDLDVSEIEFVDPDTRKAIARPKEGWPDELKTRFADATIEL